MKYWECPVCGWRVADAQYLSIVYDPPCPGCHVILYSEFRFVDEAKE